LILKKTNRFIDRSIFSHRFISVGYSLAGFIVDVSRAPGAIAFAARCDQIRFVVVPAGVEFY
jgi:hypothetical protein